MSNYLNSFSVPLWKIINELGQKNKNIVFEGAQGSMSVSYTHLRAHET